MAARTLARGVFQNEFTDSAAASGSNTYTLDSLANGIMLKVELNGNSGSAVLKVRWLSSDGNNHQLVQTLTFTAINDNTAKSEATAGYYHATAPTNIAALDGYGLKQCKIDIVSFTTVTKASVWVAGK